MPRRYVLDNETDREVYLNLLKENLAAVGNGGVCAGFGKNHGKNLGSAKRRTPVKGDQ
jgi:hypothetical protein